MITTHHTGSLFYRRCGSGDRLVVLLHGWPQTGHCWRHLMEPLGERHTVVAPDLRGYGRSGKPGSGYDKRSTAADLSRLVEELGFETAAVVGHDRGARVAHRWALDVPGQVERLALLDILPSREVMNSFDRDSAAAMWHWFFHLQPDLPELLIAGNVEAYLRFFFERQSFVPEAIDAEALAEYVTAFSDPDALHASLEDYRAGFREDLEADERDAREGNRLRLPLLLLWGAQGGLGRGPVLRIWEDYAERVTGAAIEDCKHFLPEEQPQRVLRHLTHFLAA
ncbi:alpha/beta fold hydrolase [Streptosporangium saharense]|uniref:alpha/beta fold hydrolase n=1 Tax=Streptosporangium saharense TaxID=1706840 RepID=UPI0036C5CC03